MSNDSFTKQCFLIRTLDPLHVGTGGNRLGRVDNSIVREPGTKLPKIPGTSLHGAIRQYAAYLYGDLEVAGGGTNKKADHPVNYTFGSIKESGSDGGQSGKVSIGDARLLLFPVYSMADPVWVTCPSVLAEFGKEFETADVSNNKIKSKVGDKYLNLGWLMLEKEEGDFLLPQGVPDLIKEKAVLVSDKLFSQIVNSNLEVRTSVKIDPETGAASREALFTYEAIPRATLLWFEVIEDDFSKKFPESTLGHKRPLDVVEDGLKLAEMLGVGGMGTRGFGRVKAIANWEVNDDNA